MVLRDANYAGGSGSLGKSGSGLAQRTYAQHDANWNVTALVDTGGTVQRRFVYGAYGTAYSFNGDWSTYGGGVFGSPYYWVYTFQGGRQDLTGGSNLIRFGVRDYSRDMERWMQPDA